MEANRQAGYGSDEEQVRRGSARQYWEGDLTKESQRHVGKARQGRQTDKGKAHRILK